MAKWIVVAVVLTLLAGSLVWLNWRNSPMREIERSRAAVESSKSWHYRIVRVIRGLAPESIEKDTLCPSFQRTIQSSTDRNGAPTAHDSINFFGRVYGHVGDQWLLSHGRQADNDAQGSIPIFECLKGSLASDENSLPYESILTDGTVRRGGVRDVGSESCRDYEIAVATPHDPQEKEFRFSICINEQDHLPRETRRTPPGSNQEGVSTYTQWNVLREPQLPPGIS